MNLNQSKLSDNVLPKTRHQVSNNLLKFLVYFFIGTGILGTLGYLIFRETQLNADRRSVQNCIEQQRCSETISALERLVKAKKSLKLFNLQGAHLEAAHLETARLENANLEAAHLEDANLKGAYLRGANLEGANLKGAHLENANLESANLAITQIDRAHLEDADLKSAHLSHARIENSYLVHANLDHTYLSNAHFDKTYFNRASFRGAHLYRADFEDTNLYLANLSDTYFYRTDFERANFYSANLRGAYLIEAKNLTPAQIKSACYWEQAIYRGIWDVDHFKWVRDRKANQQFIQQLKQDKSSNPSKAVDCSMWK